MSKKIRTFLLPLTLMLAAICSSLKVSAQDTYQKPEMADLLRQSGKIYVVISVLCTIFIGIIIFLITQEVRLRKLEKKLNDKHS